MKISIQIVFILCAFFNVHGQDEITQRTKKVESYFQLNGVYTSFQDAKFSNIRYNGIGTGIDIGRKVMIGIHSFQYGFQLSYSNSKSSTFKLDPGFGKIGIAREFHPSLYVKYMRELNENFSVGGRFDGLESYFRVTRGLGNNKIYYNVGANLYGKGSYRRKFDDNWEIETGIELGLLSFMRESTSFAFSAPQTVLTNGSFNYQDESTSNPFGFKHYELRPIWNYGNLNVFADVKFKQRWTFSYTWSLRRFSTVENYPTTIGIHSLGVKFDFIDKTKKRRSKKKN